MSGEVVIQGCNPGAARDGVAALLLAKADIISHQLETLLCNRSMYLPHGVPCSHSITEQNLSWSEILGSGSCAGGPGTGVVTA